mgnify:CR=1 FL=1
MIEIQLPIPAGYAGNRIIKCLDEWDEPEVIKVEKPEKAPDGYSLVKDHVMWLPKGTTSTIVDIPQFTETMTIRVISVYFYRMEKEGLIYRVGSVRTRRRPRIAYKRTGE